MRSDPRPYWRLKCTGCGVEWTTPSRVTKARLLEGLGVLTSCPAGCEAATLGEMVVYRRAEKGGEDE